MHTYSRSIPPLGLSPLAEQEERAALAVAAAMAAGKAEETRFYLPLIKGRKISRNNKRKKERGEHFINGMCFISFSISLSTFRIEGGRGFFSFYALLHNRNKVNESNPILFGSFL